MKPMLLQFYLTWLFIALFVSGLSWIFTRKVDDIRRRALIRTGILALSFAHIPLGGYQHLLLTPAITSIQDPRKSISGVVLLFSFWLFGYIAYMSGKKMLNNAPILALLLGYLISAILLAGSYWAVSEYGLAYRIVSQQGNFVIGLLTLISGTIIFLYLHFGSPLIISTGKFLFGTKIQLLVGSLALIFSTVLTAKSLHYLAQFVTLPLGAILFVISWAALPFLNNRRVKA